ncbi:ATP-binding protein [Salipaludibacillus daqingensis]|uniref:ATP-binding protein n=1 Tax=Salipaludibacillus daqingensis TaxID=3041001 RepID=UPI002476D377|nr:ATP-binding protein [Salipaludibacillus daqingensis]
MKGKEKVLDLEMVRELFNLSADFCVVLSDSLLVEEVMTDDEDIHRSLTNLRETILPMEDFNQFIDSIMEHKPSTFKQLFTLSNNGDKCVFQCKGKQVSNKIFIVGIKQPSMVQSANDILEKISIPAIQIDQDENLVQCNSHLHKLHDRLGIHEVFYFSLKNDEIKHPLFHKYSRVLNELVKTKKDVHLEYKTEEVSLLLQGLVDGEQFVILVKDQTYQRKFEQLLSYQQQMQAVSQLSAGVAHELRNPLSVIKGFIQLSNHSNNIGKYYETISSEIDRMNKIIGDFLSITRRKLEKNLLGPSELMGSMLMIFRSECTLHDIEFNYRLVETTNKLNVNEQMIKQVLLNVLRNSIEAYEGQKDRRTFTLTTFLENDTYIIKLKDEGPGMAREVLEKVKEPFFTTKEQGTGIGIPLVTKIIEDHSGSIIVESEVDKGTLITIHLPLYKHENEMI